MNPDSATMMHPSSPFMKPLTVSLTSVLPKREIVTCRTDETMASVLKKLTKYHILSAPLLDEATGAFLGFVDLMDACKAVMHGDEDDKPDLNKILVGEVTKDKPKPITLLDNVPLWYACELLAIHGYRRTAVVHCDEANWKKGISGKPESVVANICSQTDLVALIGHLLKNEEMRKLAVQPIQDLGFTMKAVDTIPKNMPLRDAVNKLVTTGYDCIAVVEPDTGVLCGNLSASDFKNLSMDTLAELDQTVGAFLLEHSPESLKPIAREATNTFLYMLETLVEHRLHHIWIIDDAKKPIGIVNNTDMLKAILHVRAPDAPRGFSNTTPGTLHMRVMSLQLDEDFAEHKPFVRISYPELQLADSLRPEVVQCTKPLETREIMAHHGPEFDFPMVEKDGDRRLMIKVEAVSSKTKKVLGSRAISVAWILNNFGSRNPAFVVSEDVFRMEPEGSVGLELFYEADGGAKAEEKPNM